MVYMHSRRVSKVSTRENRQQLSVNTSLTSSYPGKFSVKMISFLILSYVDQKIDGMCLKEGLSDDELVSCNVHTVGEKRLLQRKLSELVGIKATVLDKFCETFQSPFLNCFSDLSF